MNLDERGSAYDNQDYLRVGKRSLYTRLLYTHKQTRRMSKKYNRAQRKGK